MIMIMLIFAALETSSGTVAMETAAMKTTQATMEMTDHVVSSSEHVTWDDVAMTSERAFSVMSSSHVGDVTTTTTPARSLPNDDVRQQGAHYCYQ